MKIATRVSVCALLTIGATADVLADCSVDVDVEKAYASAQAQERAGKLKDALNNYALAQSYICGPNPLELPAARRAAQIAKSLGAAEEKQGNLEEAFRVYELGGQYADADRAMIANARAHSDDPDHVQTALKHFYDRIESNFRNVYALRLNVTGAYATDPKMQPELLAMADKGVERALQREAAAFSEPYLRERVQIIQARPDDAADFPALNAWGQRAGSFEQKWPDDPLKKSRGELGMVLKWSKVQRSIELDDARGEAIAERAHKRAEERAATLTQRYSGAPQFLQSAIAYHEILPFQGSVREPRVQQVKAQALRLGDEANAKGRLGLAHDYHEAAGDRDKAMAARDRQNQLAKQKMQPAIDEATRQAQAIKTGFGSPAQIEAMKKQAQDAAKAMQQQKPDNKDRAKKADDLDKELGLD